MKNGISLGGCIFTIIIATTIVVLSFQPLASNAIENDSINSIRLLWTRPIIGSNWGIYTDGTNVYTTGAKSQTSIDELSINKFDSDGNSLWVATRNGMIHSEGRDVLSYNSYIYSVGRAQSGSYQYSDVIVTKFDINGKEKWAKFWDGGADGDAWGVDHIGDDINVTGEILNPFQERGFILKYGDDGNLIWSRTVVSGRTRLSDIAADSVSIFVAGTGTIMSNGSSATVFKYDQDGNQLWAREWEMPSEGVGICVSNGDIYIAGFLWEDDYQFMDVLLMKYNTNGDLIWETSWGTRKTREQTGGVSCGYNRIYITGYTNISSPSDLDMFLLQYDDNGTLLFTDIWNNSYYDDGYKISTYGNETYIVGWSDTPRLWKYVDPLAPIASSVNNPTENSPLPVSIIIIGIVAGTAVAAILSIIIFYWRKRSK